MLEACQHATRLTPATPGRCSGASCSAARTPRSRSTASPAASAGGCRSRSSSTPGANVLILDEPTNHLDVESREALEDALSKFEGSLLLISHDRALLDAVGTRTVAFEDGLLRSTSAAGRSTCASAPNVRPRGRPAGLPRRRRRLEAGEGRGPKPGQRSRPEGGAGTRRRRRSSRPRSRPPRRRCRRSRTSSPTRRAWATPAKIGGVDRPARGGQAGCRRAS